MMERKTGDCGPLYFDGHGCWCGKGSRGSNVMDEFDELCKVPKISTTTLEIYRLRPGLVNFVPAVAYHFCLSLSAAFTYKPLFR